MSSRSANQDVKHYIYINYCHIKRIFFSDIAMISVSHLAPVMPIIVAIVFKHL